jgi:hypothetical protein
MEELKKSGSEITVRISVALQDAPDVHTLLAMTPVRERGKLVRLALQRYITATDHPSGNVDVQIGAISQWLRNRAPATAVASASNTDLSRKKADLGNDTRREKISPVLQMDESGQRRNVEYSGDRQQSNANTTSNEFESLSVRRWLTDDD